MKTPLPGEVPKRYVRANLYQHTVEAEAINQIIDYLAELTEVVEGKQEDEKTEPYLPAMCMCGEVDTLNGAEVEVGGVCHSLRHPCYCLDKQMPSLKQQLLILVRDMQKYYETATPNVDRDDGYNQALIDVEGVINRLMP